MSVLRVVLSVSQGVPLDVLPAITGSLGLLGLVTLIPRSMRRIRVRTRRPSEQWVEVPKDLPPRPRSGL